MSASDEKKLILFDFQNLRKHCALCWYHTLIKINIRRDLIHKQLFGVLKPRFQQWIGKSCLARISGNTMSRSSADSETVEHSSSVDEKIKHNTDLYVPVKETQWPIVYGPEYNIGFLGLERLHPFDAGKWGKVYSFLKEDGMIRDDTTVRPKEATEEDLRVVHSQKYIDSLKWSMVVAGITEVPPVAILPNFIVQRKVLRPFRYQAGGTILAAKLAMDRGWGINIGGGFHHSSSERGGGFCAYADITLAIRFLFERNPNVKKAMIIDLDAHQGNGHERDFMDDTSVYIMDVYNRNIYPHDGFAKRAIKRRVELSSYMKDADYLDLVKRNVEEALNEFTPDIIVYNAGTDILDGDPLGTLSISPQGIIERDQIVFENARQRKIPIMMVTSGGYQRTTARIIADSIKNLKSKNLISCEAAENAPEPSGTESHPSLGIPRSSSESGLFSKLRNFCFSKSPTQERIPTPSDTSARSIQDSPSIKAVPDLNLNVPAKTETQSRSQESAIDVISDKYPEESFIEKLGLDFMEHKLQNKVENFGKDNLKSYSHTDTCTSYIQNKYDAVPKLETCSTMAASNDSSENLTQSYDGTYKDKGARPKTGNTSTSNNIITQKLEGKMKDNEKVKTEKNDTTLETEKLAVIKTKDEQDLIETASFQDDQNIEMSKEVTSSDLFNNNFHTSSTEETTVTLPVFTEFKDEPNTPTTNKPGASDNETNDNEWTDFMEYDPEKRPM